MIACSVASSPACSPAVKAVSEEKIRSVLAVMPYRTSCHLSWSGIEVHRYRLEPGVTPEYSIPQLVISLPHADPASRIEIKADGKMFSAQIDNKLVSISPPWMKLSTRRLGSYETTVIFLDPLAMAETARAATGLDFPEIVPRFGIEDPLVRAIGMRLDAEIAAEHPCSQIYVDSLTAALAAHIFASYSKPVSDAMRRLSLNRSQVRRVIEFINSDLGRDLTLEALADVANMSKFHFAKSFRHAVGIAPHQFVVKARIEKARKLLLTDDTASVAEIARLVGYADPTFFASQFQKIVGVTPRGYRTIR